MPAKKSTPVKVTAVKSATKAPAKAPVKAAAPAKKAAPKKVAPVAAAKAAPAKAAPAKTAPVKAAPAKKAVAAPAPAKSAPVAKPVAAKAAPATKAATKAAPAKKAVAAAPVKAAPAKSSGKVSVLFEKFSPDSHSVEIVGSFNGWTVGKNPLKKDASGVWSGKLSLEPGTYEYKFVFDGLSYEADPGREQVWGPFGANNILIVV